MVTVELRMLPGEAGAATEFLQSKLQGQFKIYGNRIEIAGAKGRDVKLLLHMFLHREGLTGYRVLGQSGTLKIVREDSSPREEQPEDDKIKGVPPFPPLSTERIPLMGIVYPNYTSDRFDPPRKFKKGGKLIQQNRPITRHTGHWDLANPSRNSDQGENCSSGGELGSGFPSLGHH